MQEKKKKQRLMIASDTGRYGVIVVSKGLKRGRKRKLVRFQVFQKCLKTSCFCNIGGLVWFHGHGAERLVTAR